MHTGEKESMNPYTPLPGEEVRFLGRVRAYAAHIRDRYRKVTALPYDEAVVPVCIGVLSLTGEIVMVGSRHVEFHNLYVRALTIVLFVVVPMDWMLTRNDPADGDIPFVGRVFIATLRALVVLLWFSAIFGPMHAISMLPLEELLTKVLAHVLWAFGL